MVKHTLHREPASTTATATAVCEDVFKFLERITNKQIEQLYTLMDTRGTGALTQPRMLKTKQGGGSRFLN